MKSKLAICLIMCLLAGICAGCGKQETVNVQAPELKEPISLDTDTVKVEKKPISLTSTYVASVIPDVIECNFDGGGYVGEVYVKVGDKVKKGKLMAVLSGETTKSKVKQMKDQVTAKKKANEEANKQKECDIKVLNDQKKQFLDQASKATDEKTKKTALQQAELKSSDIKIAEKQLEYAKKNQELEIGELEKDLKDTKKDVGVSELYAPCDGTVISSVNKRDQVASNTTSIVLSDESKKVIMSDFVDDSAISEAQRCYGTANGSEFDVKIRDYDHDVYDEKKSKGESVYSYFDFTNSELKIGDSVIISVVEKYSPEALVIPKNAVVQNDSDIYVYVLSDGKKVKTTVKTGIINKSYAEITEGLKEGDVVYVQN